MLNLLNKKGTVVCRLPGDNNGRSLFYSPSKIITIYKIKDVIPALLDMESYLKKGFYAAGFISYEASPSFDPAHKVRTGNAFPLLWFGIYKNKPSTLNLDRSPASFEGICFVPEIDRKSYYGSFNEIKKFIRDGDTYQVNFTFKSKSGPIKKPGELFLSLCQSHPVPYPAFVNTGEFQLISNSPELFIERRAGNISSFPMKGTMGRELSPGEDIKTVEILMADTKNRAENLMIVDMVRNDFGRICLPGTIKVNPLFHVQTYPTVHQMISGVHGELGKNLSISDILSATFPPPSITGAPKIRAMEIIADTEKSSRNIYTGSIGCFTPTGNFCLNVAIRTILCGRKGTELGIGGGIVADSKPGSEWKECILKKHFSTHYNPEFDVLETILWTRLNGFKYLKEHMRRAESSQKYFGRKWDDEKIKKTLSLLKFPHSAKFARVRLRISQNGDASAEHIVLHKKGWRPGELKVAVSKNKTYSRDLFLFHKTTNRNFYDSIFTGASRKGYDEILFMNEKNEITEGAISNIFISKNNKWTTPDLKCGLLQGIWRDKMIKSFKAEESIISLQDLREADEIIIGNSVRGMGKVSHDFHIESINQVH